MDVELNPVVHLAGTRSRTSADGIEDKPTAPLEKVASKAEPRPADLEASEQPYDEDLDDFPGDRNDLSAWLVLLGSFLALFPSFGLMVSIGTVQDYWQFHQLSSYSSQTIGWIPSTFVYLSLGLGICCGPIFDRYGPRWMLLAGSLAYTVMIFLLAECKEYWQFLLCLGILGGPAGAALTTTALAVLSHWFKAKRGLASGLAMVGNSFGGVVIPLVLRAALPKYGYAWSIRILGFVFAACLIMANLLVRPRLKPSAEAKKVDIFSLELFGQPSFSLLTVSVFGIEVVLFGALGILPTYASFGTDYPPETGFYLIAVMNGVSCLGRIIPGFVSDIVGRFNVLGVMMVITLVIMLVVWLPFGHTSLIALYVFVALFGFGTGSWMAMTPACVGQLSGPHHFGTIVNRQYDLFRCRSLLTLSFRSILRHSLFRGKFSNSRMHPDLRSSGAKSRTAADGWVHVRGAVLEHRHLRRLSLGTFGMEMEVDDNSMTELRNETIEIILQSNQRDT
jgi:MFS family permease